MRQRPIALVAILALAGCVAPAIDAPTPETAIGARGPFVDPIIEEHDHLDLAEHNLSTPNLHKLGHTDLALDGTRFTSLGEIDWQGTLAVVGAVIIGAGGAIVTIDLTDPTTPVPLGFTEVREQAYPLDVKLDEKGEFAYVSVTGRILVYDVRDPKTPTLAGAATPPGAACHMSALGVIGGVEHFFCTGDPVGLTIYRITETPTGRALTPVGHSRPGGDQRPVTGAGTFGVVGAPHDMTFQPDPVDGRPLLVVSNRGFGVRVLDVSQPSLPVELGSWRGDGAQHKPHHWHTSMVVMIDGKRVLVTSPEILPDTSTPPAIWFLDATDYADLKLIAEWTAPGDHGSTGFTFTTHQWQYAQGRIYMGYYHAGVWVLDATAILQGAHLDDPDRRDVLAYYLPHEPALVEGAMVPYVWDLVLRHGVMYVSDVNSGFYALHYAPDRIGDEAVTGFS